MSDSTAGGVLVVDPAWAATAGERAFAFRQEMVDLLAASDGRRGRAVQTGLDDLVAKGALTEADARDIADVAFQVFAVERGTVSAEAAEAVIGPIYRRLRATPDANGFALTVASVGHTALASTVPAPAARGDVTIIPMNAKTGAVVGALLGAGVGLGLSGGDPIGAAIGAVVGAAVGAAIGACNKKTDPDPGDAGTH